MEIQRGGFQLRRFVIDDLARVLGLVHMTVDRSYAATYCPEARAAFKEYASADRMAADAEAGLTLVAESNGEVVGTASLVANEISRTYVHPDYQGHGLGKALMATLEREALRRGRGEVHLHSSLNARRFYLGLGYEVTETGAIPLANGQELPYFRMRKRLSPPPLNVDPA